MILALGGAEERPLNRAVPALVALAALTWSPRASALAILHVVPDRTTVVVGETLRVELRADLGAPVLGWGMDLGVDPAWLVPAAAPLIGADWLAVPAADGDGLAGLAFPSGVSGTGILLASVELEALLPGEVLLFADVSLEDPSEGFALDPTGFDDWTVGIAEIQVVPEPGSGGLLAVGLTALLGGRRPKW